MELERGTAAAHRPVGRVRSGRTALCQGLLKDVFWIAVATVASRLLGLVRDVVIADQFGASAPYDAYLIAFFIPHFLRRLLAEGALSGAFVPLYTERLQRSREEADRFASLVLSAGLLLFPVLIAAGIWLAPVYVPFLADGFSAEQRALAVRLTRLTFPFIGLVGLAAVVMGILNSRRHFAVPALAPVLFNVGVIASVLLWRGLGIEALALGVLLGGAGQLLIQLPLLRGRLRFRWTWEWRDPGLRRLGALLWPALLGLAVVQINLLVDNKLASRLPEGGISALQYAIRLFQLPLGVFAVAISTALAPRLSERAARRPAQLVEPLSQGVRLCALIVLPAGVGLFVLGGPIIRLLFEHGAFTPQATARTLGALQFYLLGLFPYALVTILARAFYALQDGRTPVWVSGVAVGVNVALAYALVGPMGVRGLALATSLAGWVNLGLLWVRLRRRLAAHTSAPWHAEVRVEALKAAGVAALMGLVAWGAYLGLAAWTANRLILVAVPVLVGAGFYGGLVRLSGLWTVFRPEGASASEADVLPGAIGVDPRR